MYGCLHVVLCPSHTAPPPCGHMRFPAIASSVQLCVHGGLGAWARHMGACARPISRSHGAAGHCFISATPFPHTLSSHPQPFQPRCYTIPTACLGVIQWFTGFGSQLRNQSVHTLCVGGKAGCVPGLAGGFLGVCVCVRRVSLRSNCFRYSGAYHGSFVCSLSIADDFSWCLPRVWTLHANTHTHTHHRRYSAACISDPGPPFFLQQHATRTLSRDVFCVHVLASSALWAHAAAVDFLCSLICG